MSELIITAKLVKTTKRFHKLSIVSEGIGALGNLYIPRGTKLPSQIVVNIEK